MEKLSKIDKLNNSNYFMWKYKVELLLINQDLWDVITDEQPSTPAALRNWMKRDNKARTTIGLLVEDNQLVHIRGKATAIDTWNALKSIHEKNTLTNRISVYKKITLTRMNESDNMENHLNNLINLFQKLEDLGDIPNEQWKIGIVFASLPQSYSTLVTALEARNEEDLTWSIVYTKLLDEFQRQNEQEEKHLKTTEEKVLKVTSSKEVTFCYFCKKNSHKMQDCFKLKRYQQFLEFEKFQKGENEKKISEANTIEQEGDELVLCMTTEEVNAKGPNLLMQINIWRQLRDFKIKIKGNIENDLELLSHLFNQLKSVDNELTDIQKIAVTANVLPKQFNKFVVLIDSRKIYDWIKFKEILLKEWKEHQNELDNRSIISTRMMNNDIRDKELSTKVGKSAIIETKWNELNNGFKPAVNQTNQTFATNSQMKKKKGKMAKLRC